MSIVASLGLRSGWPEMWPIQRDPATRSPQTRSGDTTIFSRVELLLSLGDLQGLSSISGGLAVSAFSRTLRSFFV